MLTEEEFSFCVISDYFLLSKEGSYLVIYWGSLEATQWALDEEGEDVLQQNVLITDFSKMGLN